MHRLLTHLILQIVLLVAIPDKRSSFAQDHTKILTIIHTNDLQSRLLGSSSNRQYTPFTLGDDQIIDGIARVATAIKSPKRKSPETTLVIDGGDFLVGRLFHALASEECAELQLFQEIGYDVIALGNHEFDFRPLGRAQILQAALAKGKLPALLCANIVFNETDAPEDHERRETVILDIHFPP